MAAALVLACSLLLIGVAVGSTARTQKEGGIFKVAINSFSGIDSMDPALASTPPAWALLDTTCARLLAYPDEATRKNFSLQPEVATSLPTVSRDGKTYTFTLRSSFRFSDGSPVTARAFQREINRLLAPEMKSPGMLYARDIVGAGRVVTGKADSASGIVASGNKLVIKLTRRAPDFPQRVTSTFFCAVPPTLPINPEGEADFPAAGPYTVTSYRPGDRLTIRENPHYGGTRPHHVDGFDVDLHVPSPQEVVQQVDREDADWGYTLAAIYFDPTLGIADKYGINNSGRLFLRRGLTLRVLAFNSSRPLFHNNVALRKAVNYALNRSALVGTGGPNVSFATDQYLPYSVPGFKDADIYPLEQPDLQKAKALAAGNLRGGKAILYVNSATIPMQIGQLVKQQLAEIGLDVEVRGIPIHSASAAYFAKLATAGEPWDMAFGLWSPAYIDPFAYINLLFERRFLGATNFIRLASAPYDKQMRHTAALPDGSDRNRAYAALDVRLAKDLAPLAAVDVLNEPTLISTRVGCVVLRPILDLTAACLKR